MVRIRNENYISIVKSRVLKEIDPSSRIPFWWPAIGKPQGNCMWSNQRQTVQSKLLSAASGVEFTGVRGSRESGGEG